MAISPNQQEKLATEIRRIYEDAEIQLLESIARYLVRRGSASNWQVEKLALLAPLLRDARLVVGKLDKRIPKEIEKVIELAYLAGDESAVGDLKSTLKTILDNGNSISDYESIQMVLFPDEPDIEIDIDATMSTFAGVNTEAIAALAGATTQTVTATHVPIVRAVEDIYRNVITEVAGSTLTGVETRLEVAQRALNKFTTNGVKVFRDNRGRNWEMATYAEMATRSAIGQASVQGHINKMQSMGFDLVQVSDHHEECDLCRPWEGKVLSVSGNHPKYKSLREAISKGLFHTNCGHRANTYFEGITEPLEKTKDPEGYEKREMQRYLERGVRKWKKRQAAALTDKEKELTSAKVAEWQDRLKQFTEENDRRRKYERESVTSAR